MNRDPQTAAGSDGPRLDGPIIRAALVPEDMVQGPTPASRLPKIAAGDLGLKICHEPPECDDIDVDIVAVHGIGADPKDTWTHQKTDVNWLANKDMLPASLPGSRILSFGYHSVWYGDDAVRQSLDSIANKLLGALSRIRKKCPQRPILFIAHCFGGLVVQKAYSLAAFHDTEWPNLSQSIRGMVFLATPHHGLEQSSSLSTQGQIYQTIVASGLQIQDNALKTMAHDNDLLVSTIHEFTTKIAALKKPPSLFCFYEQKVTNAGAIAGVKTTPQFVLREGSATLSGHGKEGLALDHFGMNKFEDPNDDNYQCVLYQIEEMVKKAQDSAEPESLTDRTKVRSSERGFIPLMPDLISKSLYYVQRDDILGRIDKRFIKNPRVALTGDSGSGKTHVAVEYAHKFQREGPGRKVYWVNAGSAEEFEASYRSIARAIPVAKESLRDGRFLQEVCEHLKDSTGWLLVLDGLDDGRLTTTESTCRHKSLLDFVPEEHQERVLVTTRNKLLANKVGKKPSNIFDIGPLNQEDASLLLFGKVRRSDPKSMEWVGELSEVLGGSAGSLELARNYLKATGKETTPASYLKSLKNISGGTAQTTGADCAWKLSFDMIKRKAHHAADLMLIISILDVQSVPRAFFGKSAKSEHLTVLEEFGIVEPSMDQGFYRIPAMSRHCAQRWLASHQDSRQIIGELAVSRTSARLKESSSEALLPLALAVLRRQPKSDEGKRGLQAVHAWVDQYRASRCTPVMNYEFSPRIPDSRGFTGGATQLLEHDGARRRAIEYGSDASSLQKPQLDIFLMSQLKLILAAKGRQVSEHTQEINSRGDRDLEVKSKVREVDEADEADEMPSSSLSHTDDASAQSYETRLKGSISTYERALEGLCASPSASPVQVATIQYKLALAYGADQRIPQAEKMYQAALGALRAGISHENPGCQEYKGLSLMIMSDLATMYAFENRLGEAAKIFQHLLPTQITLRGGESPETMSIRQRVALLQLDEGDTGKVESELVQVFLEQCRQLGVDHQDALRTACSIALCYRLRGDLETSEKLYCDVLKKQEDLFGNSHGDVAVTRKMLGELREKRGEGH